MSSIRDAIMKMIPTLKPEAIFLSKPDFLRLLGEIQKVQVAPYWDPGCLSFTFNGIEIYQSDLFEAQIKRPSG